MDAENILEIDNTNKITNVKKILLINEENKVVLNNMKKTSELYKNIIVNMKNMIENNSENIELLNEQIRENERYYNHIMKNFSIKS